MRIATWNVNSVHARLEVLRHWLEARSPDVVCLQELKVPNDRFPFDAIRAAGYHAIAHGEPRYNGVAVLTKAEARAVQVGLPGMEDFGARLVTAALDAWTISSVYVPNGKSIDHPDYARKLTWMKHLRDHLRASLDPGALVLVAGDFNVTPTDLDTCDADGLRGQIHHSEPERAALQGLIDDGLADLVRLAHPGKRMFTWWDYRAGSFHRDLGLRLDLLLGTHAVAEHLRDAWVDRDYRKKLLGQTPSDHAPVVVDLEAPKAFSHG